MVHSAIKFKYEAWRRLRPFLGTNAAETMSGDSSHDVLLNIQSFQFEDFIQDQFFCAGINFMQKKSARRLLRNYALIADTENRIVLRSQLIDLARAVEYLQVLRCEI